MGNVALSRVTAGRKSIRRGDYKRAECHRTLLSEIKDGGMETLHTTITHNAQQSEH